jgi:hypothetical protein
MAVVEGRKPCHGADIHDRYVDWIIGLPLLLAALVIVVLLPAHFSLFFWLWRLDLLSLPVFVAGAVSLVFGLRALWRFRIPIGFLALTWPLPQSGLAAIGLSLISASSQAGLALAVQVFPMIRPATAAAALLPPDTQLQVIPVGFAEAATNFVAAFVIAALAVLFLIRGSWPRKLTWLASGTALTWLLILGALLINGSAPSPFSLTLSIGGLVVMVLALPAFGLPSPTALLAPASRMTGRGQERVVRVPVARARWALCAVLLAAVFAALAGSTMSRFDLLLGPMGQARLSEFGDSVPRVTGWVAVLDERAPEIGGRLGSDVTWRRYRYRPLIDWSPADPASSPMIVDILASPRPVGPPKYGVDARYGVHERVVDQHVVDLGAGLTGELAAYAQRNGAIDWVSVSWDWPVQTLGSRRYEHVIVSLWVPGTPRLVLPTVDRSGWMERAQLAVADWLDGSRTVPLDSSVLAGRDLLVGFATEMVRTAVTEAQSSAGAGQ